MASKKVIKDVRDNGGWDGIEYQFYETENRAEPEKKREQASSNSNKTKIVAEEMSKEFEKVLLDNKWVNVILKNEKMEDIMSELNRVTERYGLKPRHNLKTLLDYTQFEKVKFNTGKFIIRYKEDVDK